MLKFQVTTNGQQASDLTIGDCYLLGSDNSALRAEIKYESGLLLCQKRGTGPAALVVQREMGGCGRLTAQTCLLPDHEHPYLLDLELARHQLMALYNKLEDWALFDLDEGHPAMRRFDLAKRLFIEALKSEFEDPAKSSRLAIDSLIAAVDGGEELALAHSELLLNQRIKTKMLPKCPMGCGAGLDLQDAKIRDGLLVNMDFLCLPMPWKRLSPEEGEYQWEAPDRWAQWIMRLRKPVIAGPVISFEPRNAPDWLFIWEHDYDTLRDLVYDHTEKVVTRYRKAITAWNVVSGLHINEHLPFTFEQIMDLTRMCTLLVKKIQPAAKALVEICQPFGEYYGSNPRSIPPLSYADLMVQGAVQFDGFIIKLLMGQTQPGRSTRDLLQISHLLDQFMIFDKPINVVVGVPSQPVVQPNDPEHAGEHDPGYWRKPWSSMVQSHWLEAVFQIALSKPFVEAVAWDALIDGPAPEPAVGLIDANLQAKSSLRRFFMFRQRLLAIDETSVPANEESGPTAESSSAV